MGVCIMRNLHTQAYLEAHLALHERKYPKLGYAYNSGYPKLVGMLTAFIELGESIESIQASIDNATSDLVYELRQLDLDAYQLLMDKM